MNKIIVGMIGVSVVVAGLSIGVKKADALSCAPVGPEWYRDNSSIIFVGKVTNIQQLPNQDIRIERLGDVTFKVSKYWKGDVSQTMTIRSVLHQWAQVDTNFYEVGTEYLIYANQADEKIVSTNFWCGGTRPLIGAEANLATLGEGKVPTTVVPNTNNPKPFTRNLTIGSSGEDVVRLQTILESMGYLKMPQGVAKGYFGQLTRKALANYQLGAKITPAAGYFGPITRAHISATPAQ